MDSGAAVMMEETIFEVDALTAEIEKIMTDPEGARKMAAAAMKCAVPDATNRLETLVETLANGPDA